MALIQCTECGKEVSDKAKVCPHCGNPMESLSDMNEQCKIQLDESSRTSGKRKSYLAKAVLLWPLLILEVIILLVLLIVTSGSNSLLSIIAEYIIWFFAAFNIILGAALAVRVFRYVKPDWKLKKKPIKNTVALILSLAFAVFNCYCLSGAAMNALNITPSKQHDLTKEEEIAIEACQDFQSRLKNPASLQLHNVLVSTEAGYYTYIDCSAENGFGGMARTVVVYFEDEYKGDMEDGENSYAEAVLELSRAKGTCKSISTALISEYLD